jgi:hypothetical protein
MNDDWWAFIATIDRVAILNERPGSAADRAMRSQHAARVAEYHARDNPAERRAAVEEAAAWARQFTADRNARRERTHALDEQIRAYAARKHEAARAAGKVA